MNNSEIKHLLFNESVNAIEELRDGCNSIINLEEQMERFVICRIILGNTQLFDMSYVNNGREITFGFSPYYMLENRSKVYKDSYDKIIWKFKLPPYIWDTKEGNDEGIDSWLSKGKVVVDKLSYDKNIVKDIYYKKIKDYFNQ